MLLIDAIANNIDKDEYFSEIFSRAELLNASQFLGFSTDYELTRKEIIDLLRIADIFSNSTQSKYKNKAYYILGLLSDQNLTDEVFQIYTSAILTKLGNFPAIKYIEKTFKHKMILPLDRSIEKLFKEDLQKIPGSEQTFTDTQYLIFRQLIDSKNFSFSGPTSMGKSFLMMKFIHYLIENKTAKKIVLVVPTRALINQFSLEIRKELKEEIKSRKCLVYSNSPRVNDNSTQANVLILTPERVLSLLSEKIDFNPEYVFIDEAHKIASLEDSRSVTYYKAIQRLSSKYREANFIFLSPNVSNPGAFVDLYKLNNRSAYHAEQTVVSQNLYFLDLIEQETKFFGMNQSYSVPSPVNSYCSDPLEIISQLGSSLQNIVYCSTPTNAVSYALTYSRSQRVSSSEHLKKAITKIKKFVHKDFYLIDCLERGVAFHYGRLPHELRIEIEDLFKAGHIRTIFCTSTLLEGVNLPAKNIFILSNRKGNKLLDQIDFWNLAGRAGRLTKELSGNIICIREKERDWKNVEHLVKHDSLSVSPTVLSQTEKYQDEITKILSGKELKKSISQEKRNILEYIANIICLETPSPSDSPIITSLNDEKGESLIELASERISENIVPFYILNVDPSIAIEKQNRVYKYILDNKDQFDLRFPSEVTYESCLEILNRLNEIYLWKEKDLSSEARLTRIAFLMSNWIQSYPLNLIINQSIKYHHVKGRNIFFEFKLIPFDRLNRSHINHLITGIIDDIEKVLRFELQKYFNNYYLMLTDIFGLENAGRNWGEFLEYGTSDTLIIELQNLGLSRHLSQFVVDSHKEVILYKENIVDSIDFSLLITRLDEDSIEYDEVMLLI